MKLGLSLSGGGIKGVAHIGAIKAMEEENIKFDAISGTSSGSIVATLLAVGYSAEEIYKFFEKYAKSITYVDLKNIFKIIVGLIFRQRLIIDGLNSGIKIEKLINTSCKCKKINNISDIKKELMIPAVDAKTGKVFIFNSCNLDYENNLEKYISKINIGRAVRASCTYPLIFSPCPYFDTNTGKKYKNDCSNLRCKIQRILNISDERSNLLDGGIKENIPYKELEKINCDKIISINFRTNKIAKCCNNAIDIGFRAFELINEELTRHELEDIDFLHTIHLEDVSLLDSSKMKSLYDEGYIQTKNNINKIKSYINNKMISIKMN